MWDAIGAVSSALSTMSVVTALVFAARQVREAKDSRAMATLLAVHKECQSPTLNKIRRRLRDGDLGDLSRLNAEDRSDLSDLLQQLELVGFLVERGLVELEDAESIFPNLPRTYAKAWPYIAHRREQDAGYAAKLERLVRRY
ncbi:DUF4760 domain-containing protein [Streptomyces sp. enrichment culture]|uniref:DUF4760 domain-containing protein n=1 Tax=Streptomyces sp. enrichment culture TaxID=1795815 RepID=UPI003F56A429